MPAAAARGSESLSESSTSIRRSYSQCFPSPLADPSASGAGGTVATGRVLAERPTLGWGSAPTAAGADCASCGTAPAPARRSPVRRGGDGGCGPPAGFRLGQSEAQARTHRAAVSCGCEFRPAHAPDNSSAAAVLTAAVADLEAAAAGKGDASCRAATNPEP